MLVEGFGGALPSLEDQNTWADAYGLTSIPVLAIEAEHMEDTSDLFFQFVTDWMTPSVYQLGPDMTVLAADIEEADPGPWL